MLLPRSRRSSIYALLLVSCFALGCTDEGSDETPDSKTEAPETPTSKLEVDDLILHGRASEAIAKLRAEVKKNPRDVDSRGRLGRLLDSQGDTAGAIEVWSAGIRGKPSDRGFHLAIGEARFQQSRRGPGPAVSGMPVSVSREFRAKHLRLARASFERALRVAPDDEVVMRRLALVFIDAKDWEPLEKLLATAVAKYPEDAKFAGQHAQVLERRGNRQAALAEYRRALDLDPRMSVSHTALAKDFEARGDTANAKLSRRKALFYRWAPPFFGVEYSESNYALFERLAGAVTPGTTVSPDELATRRHRAITQLLDEDSDLSRRLLATACWYHQDHGEFEKPMFRALAESKGPSDLLVTLVRRGRQPCVVKHAIHELARIRAPEAFDLLAERLPGDIHPVQFVDAAGALATLQDPRAVDVLAKVVRPSLALGAAGRKHDSGAASGSWMNRIRSTYALGAYDNAKARELLRKGLSSSDLEATCRAALYRLDGASEDLRALRKVFDEGGRLELPPLAAMLYTSDNAELKKISMEVLEKGKKVRESREGSQGTGSPEVSD